MIDINDILKLKRDGLTCREIGNRLGCTTQNISDRLIRGGYGARDITRVVREKALMKILSDPAYDYYYDKDISDMVGFDVSYFKGASKKIAKAFEIRSKRRTLERLFDSLYCINPDTGCWDWTGHRMSGYARIAGRVHGVCLSSTMEYGHHYSYKRFVGPIDDGKHVLHKCGNSACVNPDHLYLGTHQQNMDDRNRMGRATGAKFNYDIAEAIREKYASKKTSYQKLAEEYGCTPAAIYRIIKHVTYRTRNSHRKKTERDKQMANMYIDGIPLHEIVKFFNLKSHSHVYRALERNGIEPNRNE